MVQRSTGHRFSFFFFNDTATTEIYTLSLHDALPISGRGDQPAAAEGLLASLLHDRRHRRHAADHVGVPRRGRGRARPRAAQGRSEEHTSELQSRQYLVCRLLLEKKKTTKKFLYFILL